MITARARFDSFRESLVVIAMISAYITRVSAILLLLAGLALLFAADAILPVMIVSYPPSGHWLGQILGAGLLGLASFNYFNRSALIGGIYGRAVVASNMTFYFVTAMVLLRHLRGDEASVSFLLLTAVAALFAGVYGWLLFRGPFKRDLTLQKGPGQLASSETNTSIKT